MKIVSTSYTNTPEFNDPEQWLDRISFYAGTLEELAKQHEVESIEQINYSGELKRSGVLYRFLNYKKRKLYFPRSLHRHIKKIGPDIVLVNGFIFPLQIIQLRLKLGRAVKIIVLHRSEKPFNGFKRYLQKLADRCVDAYLFTSSEFGEKWKSNLNVRKIHEVIQVSSAFYKMDRKAAVEITKVKGTPVFLWVGGLNANKDPLTVVKAFLRFIEFKPGAKLYMIYQNNELLNEIRNLIQLQKNAGEAIRLVGKIEHPQLQEWYSAADFIVSGSHHEGSGIAVCEAMSCGCIPLLTNIPSFSTMTGHGTCGLLYEPGNDGALLKVLLQTPELNREEERNKTLQQFKTELSFEAIARKIEQVIASL